MVKRTIEESTGPRAAPWSPGPYTDESVEPLARTAGPPPKAAFELNQLCVEDKGCSGTSVKST